MMTFWCVVRYDLDPFVIDVVLLLVTPCIYSANLMVTVVLTRYIVGNLMGKIYLFPLTWCILQLLCYNYLFTVGIYLIYWPLINPVVTLIDVDLVIVILTPLTAWPSGGDGSDVIVAWHWPLLCCGWPVPNYQWRYWWRALLFGICDDQYLVTWHWLTFGGAILTTVTFSS